MKCYKCGNTIRDNIKYCPACGAELYVTQELLDAAKRNEEWATTDLYNRTFDKVFHAIYAMVKQKETTEDLLQDTYIKAFTSLSQLNEASKFDAWIKRIAHNQTVDYLRKSKPILFSELSQGEESDMEVEFEDTNIENLPEEVMDQKETARILGEMLDMLSEDQRVVVGMRASGYSFKEIGETLGVSENTVKYRFYAAQKKLTAEKEELEKKGIKLFGLAPMASLLALFSQDAAMAAELPNAAILQAVQAHLAATGVAGVAGAAAAGKAGVAAAGKSGAAVTAKTLGTKAIVGIVVACVAGGTAAAIGGVTAYNHRQNAAEETVQEDSVSGETENPVESESDETSMADKAYQEVLDDYLIAVTDSNYDNMDSLGMYDQLEEVRAYSNDIYPDVSAYSVIEYRLNDCPIYYSYFDINGDGQEELLIGGKGVAWDAEDEITTMAIYTFDGQQAVKVLDDDARSTPLFLYDIAIFTNGCMVADWGGDDGGAIGYYFIAGDGYTLEQTGMYDVSWEDDEESGDAYEIYYVWNGDEISYLSEGDISAMYQENVGEATEVELDWTELVSDNSAGSAANDYYILPDSDTRYYTASELSDLTTDELRLARNEIYARHGRIFDSADLQEYFESQAWYQGTVTADNFDENMLNEYEKANVQTIQTQEESEAQTDSGESGFSFSDIAGKTLTFSSGVGGWADDLNVQSDGTFSGVYYYHYWGDESAGTPETYYVSDYAGKFSTPTKVNSYVYSTTVESYAPVHEPDTEEMIDGILYDYGDSEEFEVGEEITIYLPGMPASELPEDVLSRLYGVGEEDTLSYYVLSVPYGEVFYNQ